MPKDKTPSLTDEQIQEKILHYLYERWRTPKSIDSIKAKLSEIQKAMKSIGINREEVNRDLSYLVDTRWVTKDVEESQFRKGKSVFTRETNRTFRISPSGIEGFQGKTKFHRADGIAGINIQNVSGVVNVGDENYIRNESVSLFKVLDELDGRIRMSNQLTDEQKLEYQADVKTIQNQLPKATPDKGIVQKTWDALGKLATIATIAEVLEKARPIIMKLLGL
jgi:hypothetical protein